MCHIPIGAASKAIYREQTARLVDSNKRVFELENEVLRRMVALENELAIEKRARLKFQREVCDNIGQLLNVLGAILELCRTK